MKRYFLLVFIIIISLIGCSDTITKQNGSFEQIYISPNTVLCLIEQNGNLIPKTFCSVSYIIAFTEDSSKINTYQYTKHTYGFDTIYIFLDEFDDIKAGSENHGKFGIEYFDRIK